MGVEMPTFRLCFNSFDPLAGRLQELSFNSARETLLGIEGSQV